MYNETKQKNKQKCQIYSNTVNMFVLVTIVFSEDSELEKKNTFKYSKIFYHLRSVLFSCEKKKLILIASSDCHCLWCFAL